MTAPQLYAVKLSGALVDHRFLDSTVFRCLWQRVASHFEQFWDTPDLQADVRALRTEADAERASGRADFVRIPSDESASAIRAACVEAVRRKLQESRRTPAVASVSGRMLLEALAQGEIRAQVYADTRAAFQRWTRDGAAVLVYDDSPEPLQQAWLKTSVAGDLTPLVKRFVQIDASRAHDPRTWADLAEALGRPARLATDRTFEALAASHADYEAVVLERDGVFGTAPHGLRVETNLLAV